MSLRRNALSSWLLVISVAASAWPVAATDTPQSAKPAAQKFEADGVSVKLLTSQPMEGDDVELRFAIQSADGTRMSGIRPAAWLDAHDTKETATGCRDKIQAFLGGTLRARPVADLNSYYIVTLNAEPSVAVIDPLIGFGGSKLLTAITLQAPGADWALSPDQRRLFVSMPLVNRIAVIDTEQWEIIKNIDTPFQPGRLTMRDDGQLWVATEKTATVIDAQSLNVAASIPLGGAPHQIAFNANGKHAFITNGASGTVSILDAIQRTKIVDLATGPSPIGIAMSTLAGTAYVIDANGSIAVVDATSHAITKRIEAKAGLNSIQFAPGGRWAFVTNGKENVVHILDASTATIVTTASDVGKQPDQVAFTDDFAYVRAAGSDQVKMIQLAALGKETEANIATFPGGQLPPSAAEASSFASAIVSAPEPKAVLVANPADRLVYYYSEGMAAPMGKFSAARRSPKAALVLDRSLRETEPGVYSIRTKAPHAGRYDVAFFLNAPRVVHCFDLTVGPDPTAKQIADGVKIEPLFDRKAIRAGKETELQFRITNPKNGELYRDVPDLRVLAMRTAGHWHRKVLAERTDDGLYHVKLTVPETGVYQLYVESESLQLKVNDGRPVIFQARPAE